MSDSKMSQQSQSSEESIKDLEKVTEEILDQNSNLRVHGKKLTKILHDRKSLKKTINEAMEENKKLSKQLKCLQRDIQQQGNVGEMYEEEAAMRDSVLSDNRDLKKQVSALQLQLQETEDLKQKLSKSKSERKYLERENADPKSKLQKLQENGQEEERKSLSEKFLHFMTLKRQTDTLRRVLDNIKKNTRVNEEMKKEYPKFIEETSQLEDLKIQLLKEISDRRQRHEETRQLADKYNDQLDKLESLKEEIKILTNKKNALGDFYQDPTIVRAKLDEMKAERKDMVKKKQNLLQELANLKELRKADKNMKEESDRLKKEIKELEAQLLTPKHALSGTQNNIKKKQIKEQDKLQVKFQANSEELSRIEEQNNKVNEEVLNLRKQKNDLTQMVADLNTYLHQKEYLLEELKVLHEEKVHLANMIPQLHKLEAECKAAKAETDDLMKQKTKLENQVEELYKAFDVMDDLKSELKNAKRTNYALIAKNISLEKLIKGKTQDLQTLERHNEALQMELNDQQSHLQKSKEMEEHLTRITREVASLEDLAKQRESQILVLKDELANKGDLEAYCNQQNDSLVSWKQKTENLEKERTRLTEKLQNPKEGTWASDKTGEGLKRNFELNVHDSVLQEQNVQNSIPAATKECLTANKTAGFLQTKVMNLEVELHTLKQETVDFQEELKDLQKRNQEEEKIRLSYRAMLQEKWDLEMKREELKTRVSFLRQHQNKGSKLGLECKNLKEHLDSVKQETEKLNQELRDLQG